MLLVLLALPAPLALHPPLLDQPGQQVRHLQLQAQPGLQAPLALHLL